MKSIVLLMATVVGTLFCGTAYATFSDNFESYTSGQYLPSPWVNSNIHVLGGYLGGQGAGRYGYGEWDKFSEYRPTGGGGDTLTARLYNATTSAQGTLDYGVCQVGLSSGPIAGSGQLENWANPVNYIASISMHADARTSNNLYFDVTNPDGSDFHRTTVTNLAWDQWYDVKIVTDGTTSSGFYKPTGAANWTSLGSYTQAAGFSGYNYAGICSSRLGTIDDINFGSGTSPIEGKKLIKWGLDSPNSAYVRQNITQMETWAFDGIAINADLHNYGLTAWLNGHMFSTRPFTYSELSHIVDDMKATTFTRFTDNFLVMGTSVESIVYRDGGWNAVPQYNETVSSPDWFNDAEFSILVSNWALAARICREAGMKGFLLDLEQWSANEGTYPLPWSYNSSKLHNGGNIPTFQECYAKWQQRGRELMAAICQEYPDIAILNYVGSHDMAYDSIRYDQNPDLANSTYGLVVPFLDGMLQGIPTGSNATLIDGGPLYQATFNSRFQDYRAVNYARSLSYSQVPAEFQAHMRLGFGTWIDGRGWRANTDGGYVWSQTSPYYWNQFTPDELAHAVSYSLMNADKYAWLWSEQAVFFPGSGKAQVLFGPNATVNNDYRNALVNAKLVYDVNYTRNDRGALTDSPSPIASQQPGYSDTETFSPLDGAYQFVADLPTQWLFYADKENIGFYPYFFGSVDWDYCGWNWRNWATIETGDYIENRGYQFNGHAWYRCEVVVPDYLAGKPIYLMIGGITMHPAVGAYVYVNGQQGNPIILSGQPTGNTVRGWDITGQAKPGQKNVVVVVCLNYDGPGGIYKRGVKLATARPPISGTIELSNYVGDPWLAPVKIQVMQGSSVVQTEEARFTTNPGMYSLNVSAGTYNLVFSTSKWLRKKVSNVVVPASGGATVSVTLINGDVRGDNAITGSDTNILLPNLDKVGD